MRKQNKYRNVKTVIDGITFDSKKEAKRYQELMLLNRAGEIGELMLQPEWVFPDMKYKSNCRVRYRADFKYLDKNGKWVIEDVKGMKTPIYKLKWALMKYFFNIEVVET